jgi:hypothetical protein
MNDENYDVYTGPVESTNAKLDEINATLQGIRRDLPSLKTDLWMVFWVFLVFMFFTDWEGSKLDRWTDRVWYSMHYDAKWENVDINKRPLNCDFMHAPLGSKGCHYKKNKFVFGDAERSKLLQDAATPAERQEISARPNTVMVYWEKKED